MRITDKSIYEDVKRGIDELLSGVARVSLKEEDPLLVDELLLCDTECYDQLKIFEKRLRIEYGDDEEILKQFGISTIVKFINYNDPTSYYKLYKKFTWEQVNDRDKVRERLDAKFAKWKNKYKKNTLDALQKKNAKPDAISKVMDDIAREVNEASRELEYIKANFEELDVRISDYENRNAYTTVTYSFYATGKKNKPIKKFNRVTLRREIYNALWYEPEKEECSDSELLKYLKSAKRAFDCVYYKQLEEGEK